MNKKELKDLQKEALECLDCHFPKSDKRRGDALVVLTIFQMLGRREMEYIINNQKTKSINTAGGNSQAKKASDGLDPRYGSDKNSDTCFIKSAHSGCGKVFYTDLIHKNGTKDKLACTCGGEDGLCDACAVHNANEEEAYEQ